MRTHDPLVCRSLSKSHNFLFGSSTTTSHFNYTNTCSLNSASSLTSLVYESWGWPSGLDHKLAIKKAIQKSLNWNLSRKLFQDDSNDEKYQFVGFVSSHKKGALLKSFHIHSFVVFHSDLQKNTIVTCILTSQNHIVSNMQDPLLQLMQLIQYCHVYLFSTVITNEFIGKEF